MSDIVKDLLFKASDQEGIGWTPTTVVPVPAGLLHRAADEIERLKKEALFTADTVLPDKDAEIERLRAALDVVRASGLLIGSTTLHDKVRAVVHAALAEENKDDR